MRRTIVSALLLFTAISCSPLHEVTEEARPVAQPNASVPGPVPSSTERVESEFRGSVSTLDAATRARMTFSWRTGCPVPLKDLRILRMTHRGFDRRVHAGELVVHEDHAGAVLGVFRSLFDAEFPIERMELVDEYEGDDDLSMAANNTSAFNCRPSTGSPGEWSQHAYGLAIDINPVQNPYVTKSGSVEPPKGAAYVDRSTKAPGVIHRNDAVVQAFARIGWEWGGDWTSAKDYQHFSANGL
ncbi:MAG: M15 family metallopeptidase [Actinomycetota bacterium]